MTGIGPFPDCPVLAKILEKLPFRFDRPKSGHRAALPSPRLDVEMGLCHAAHPNAEPGTF